MTIDSFKSLTYKEQDKYINAKILEFQNLGINIQLFRSASYSEFNSVNITFNKLHNHEIKTILETENWIKENF
jgi:hypothetical protein